MARLAYLGLGSNLGDRRGYLRAALDHLARAGLLIRRLSHIYETEPVGVSDQPRFLNLVAEVEVPEHLGARDLLALAKRIEQEVGRVPRGRWAPREIDIDLLLVEDEEVKDPDLELPHPRMWERAFVMVPLAELAPELRGPSGETAREAAERLRGEQAIYASLPL